LDGIGSLFQSIQVRCTKSRQWQQRCAHVNSLEQRRELRRAGIIHFVSALHGADIVDKNDVRRFVGQVQADENTHNVLDRLYVSVSALSAKTNTAWQRCAHV
jgi:hypothetical protein